MTTSVAASGSPHDTPKTSAVVRKMNNPWIIATEKRPSASPTMIVPALVGDANMRREIPSWRVRMSWAAAVIEIMKMNITSWLCAPIR